MITKSQVPDLLNKWAVHINNKNYYRAISISICIKNEIFKGFVMAYAQLEEDAIDLIKSTIYDNESSQVPLSNYNMESFRKIQFNEFVELELLKAKNYFKDYLFFRRNIERVITRKLQNEMGLKSGFWGNSKEMKIADGLREKFNKIDLDDFLNHKAVERELNQQITDIKFFLKDKENQNTNYEEVLEWQKNLLDGLKETQDKLNSITNEEIVNSRFKLYYNSNISI